MEGETDVKEKALLFSSIILQYQILRNLFLVIVFPLLNTDTNNFLCFPWAGEIYHKDFSIKISSPLWTA